MRRRRAGGAEAGSVVGENARRWRAMAPAARGSASLEVGIAAASPSAVASGSDILGR